MLGIKYTAFLILVEVALNVEVLVSFPAVPLGPIFSPRFSDIRIEHTGFAS